MMPEVVKTPRIGDLLIGFWPDGPGWPDDWTPIRSDCAYRRYDGIMLDHVPFVVVIRGIRNPSFDDPALIGTTTLVVAV